MNGFSNVAVRTAGALFVPDSVEAFAVLVAVVFLFLCSIVYLVAVVRLAMNNIAKRQAEEALRKMVIKQCVIEKMGELASCLLAAYVRLVADPVEKKGRLIRAEHEAARFLVFLDLYLVAGGRLDDAPLVEAINNVPGRGGVGMVMAEREDGALAVTVSWPSSVYQPVTFVLKDRFRNLSEALTR